jgi:trigger factor
MSKVDVPIAMVDTEIENQITQMRSRVAQSGMDLETFLQMSNQTEEDLREDMREDAARRVRNSLVLQQVTEEENLLITEADIEAEIDRMVAGMESPERMRSIYQSEYFRERLESELQDRKITERILEIATEGKGAVTGEGAEVLKQDDSAADEVVEVEGTLEESSDDDVDADAETSEANESDDATADDATNDDADANEGDDDSADEDEDEPKPETT